MKKFYKNKKILITGGTGLIGIQLVNLLLGYEAKITVVSMDDKKNLPNNKNLKFFKLDLRDLKKTKKIFSGQDYVFHLAGIKGSPLMSLKNPYKFMIPMLMFNTNILEACRVSNVKRLLFTSSIGVYNQKGIMKESDVWNTFPSKNDWFAGWAKRIGELGVEALKINNKKIMTTIVRPANVFGPWDNFDSKTGMVIPSLIQKFEKDKIGEITVWGDGSNIRDFIYSKDVAKAMILVMYKSPKEPINLGCGSGISIKKLVNTINEIYSKPKKIIWDIKKIGGDKKRVLNISNLKNLGFGKFYDFKEALIETLEWYRKHKSLKINRYNAFNEK